MAKDVQKGFKLAKKFINKARNERDEKGYRENLGYDLLPKFKEQLSKIIDECENYSSYYQCVNYFNQLCDTL